MVRVTSALFRIPVIKFHKGGLSLPAITPSAAQAPAPSSAAAQGSTAPPRKMQTAATMSTPPIPDIDLPLRYRRTPFSEEEIELVNSGGVV